MSESTQHKLSRVRSPRVQITYDVETGGALEKKEIPFIVGILAPLAAKSEKVLPPVRDRKLVNVDRDNFNKYMESVEPRVAFEVPRTLPNGDSTMMVDIKFTHIDDFDPVAVVGQVADLAALYGSRSRLRDFLGKLDGNDGLTKILVSVLGDAEKVSALQAVVETAKEGLVAAQSLEDVNERAEAVLTAFAEDGRSEGSDIYDMLTKGKMVLEDGQIPYALELIAEFVEQVVIDNDLLSQSGDDINLGALLTRRVSQKDKLMSRQLNYILHHDDFQEIEASWRGLHYLVMNTETNSRLKLKVLNVSFDDLYKDLDKAVEFDQSGLFKMIYEEEYGTYGGEPYSLLIGDYQLGRTARDANFLEKISNVAAAAHAPFISSAYAKLFDMEDFDSLHKPRDLSKIFESAELIKWRSFRESEDSRYVSLTLPKVMMRLPYHHENNPVEGIYFDEDVAVNLFKLDENGELERDSAGNPVPSTVMDEDGIDFESTQKQIDARKVLWGNPSYILAQRITNAFSLYGWTAAIRGVEGGGLVQGLPAYTYETEEGDITLSCPTQVSITDRREKELNDLGFMAICHCKGTDQAAFFGGQTTNKAKQYLTDSATKNAQVSSMLPYMLSASRFAHYIKVMMRERIGSFMTRQNVEDYLNTWISQYVLLDDSAPQHIKAQYPLREARVEVTDVEGKVGAYRATVFLRPHFQLEELTTSIRLVADLPS
jgi:type VI secretion system protein ImpC|tara:strand:- start:404 stop:2542 length:2139 start_codon:yes stop_codon:yes gene_type:complete